MRRFEDISEGVSKNYEKHQLQTLKKLSKRKGKKNHNLSHQALTCTGKTCNFSCNLEMHIRDT